MSNEVQMRQFIAVREVLPEVKGKKVESEANNVTSNKSTPVNPENQRAPSDSGKKLLNDIMNFLKPPTMNTQESNKSPVQNPLQDNLTQPQNLSASHIQKDAAKAQSKDGGAEAGRVNRKNPGADEDGTKKDGGEMGMFALNKNDNQGRFFPEVGGRYTRKKSDEDEDDDNDPRRRKKSSRFSQQRKPLSIIEGAKVAESGTQDMFVSSSVSSYNPVRNKTTVEQLKEYEPGNLGLDFNDIISANFSASEKNGIGTGMQRNLFGELAKVMSEIDDVLTNKYRKAVREIVQATMGATKANQGDMKDMVKMLVTGLMATSPHDDDPKIMAETIKIIVSELIYGKINLGYNMKNMSFYLGSAAFSLAMFYRNYQSDVEFTKETEQKFNSAFSEGIWKATGEISNYSQAYAKANIEQFTSGRISEEDAFNKVYLKDMMLSPIKKVLKR